MEAQYNRQPGGIEASEITSVAKTVAYDVDALPRVVPHPNHRHGGGHDAAGNELKRANVGGRAVIYQAIKTNHGERQSRPIDRLLSHPVVPTQTGSNSPPLET